MSTPSRSNTTARITIPSIAGDHQFTARIDRGTAAGDTADRFVRDTVLFASVLFLVAIAQRFKLRSVRVATTAIAIGVAAYTTFAMLALPRR
jgi:hypothetical protein